MRTDALVGLTWVGSVIISLAALLCLTAPAAGQAAVPTGVAANVAPTPDAPRR